MISWNCQGLGNEATQSHLKDLVNQHDPEIVFLSETKNKKHYASRVILGLNYNSFFIVDPVGLSGGV